MIFHTTTNLYPVDHARKIRTGLWEYRHFELANEGGYWSIGMDGFAVARNPHLDSLRAAKLWVDAHLAGNQSALLAIEKDCWKK